MGQSSAYDFLLSEASAASLTAERKTLLFGVEQIPSAELQFSALQGPREWFISHLIVSDGIKQNFPVRRKPNRSETAPLLIYGTMAREPRPFEEDGRLKHEGRTVCRQRY
jgi:hypothetical protein